MRVSILLCLLCCSLLANADELYELRLSDREGAVREVERGDNYSVLISTFKFDGSVGPSLFYLMVNEALAEDRGLPYFVTVDATTKDDVLRWKVFLTDDFCAEPWEAFPHAMSGEAIERFKSRGWSSFPSGERNPADSCPWSKANDRRGQ